ncbi:MAG: alanine--tRNA ligase [Candidatus Heimdallarchaeota archaeon]
MKTFKKAKKQELAQEFAKYYPCETMKELGFTRKTCHCGNNFWTLQSDRTTCGDPACEGGYHFIGNPPTSKRYGYEESWRAFAKTFEEFGHTEIPRYSVVARHRDDTDFTQASIYDFQPYVVQGLVEPPANPLVVPQFCLRFNDLPNIGLTGSHNSLFIMMGQHVFNRPGKFIYFKDDAIKYLQSWLTIGMGIPAEEITWVEDIWAGGGNWGPSMEFFVRGMELGNCVFMEFQLLPDGSSRELQTQVIDMGSGLERYPWVSQGTPTSYDVVFPFALSKAYHRTGTRPKDFWSRFAPYAGFLNFDEVENLSGEWQRIAQILEMDSQEIRTEIQPMKDLYAIVEHARALLVAIADGGLPSNVGGGYNLRFLLRRTLSLIDHYNYDLTLSEMADWHMDELKTFFPELQKAREGSLYQILEVEEQRYRKTLKKGRKALRSILKKKQSLQVEELVDIYDSQGITPEIAQDVAKEMKISLKIPENFIEKVQEKHEQRKSPVVMEEHPILDLANLEPTRKLFYELHDEAEFTAQVLAVFEKRYVVLDQTLFYPTSGGQICDSGTLNNFLVREVFFQGPVIIHDTINASFDVGDQVKGMIDLEARKSVMRMHTATHIINEAARNILGPHVWQAGALKTPTRARLDITHYESLSFQQEQKIELQANRIVIENRNVSTDELTRDEAERLYGQRIYQGGAVPGEKLRIVTVAEWDVEACGGTHSERTGDIGLIKLLNSERIQDGIVRLNFIAGDVAVAAMQKRDRILRDIEELWGVPEKDISQTADRFFREWKQQKKRLKAMAPQIIATQIQEKLTTGEKELIVLEVETDDPRSLLGSLATIAEEIDSAERNVVILGPNSGVGRVGSPNGNIQGILEQFFEKVKGNAKQAQGFKRKKT